MQHPNPSLSSPSSTVAIICNNSTKHKTASGISRVEVVFVDTFQPNSVGGKFIWFLSLYSRCFYLASGLWKCLPVAVKIPVFSVKSGRKKITSRLLCLFPHNLNWFCKRLIDGIRFAYRWLWSLWWSMTLNLIWWWWNSRGGAAVDSRKLRKRRRVQDQYFGKQISSFF